MKINALYIITILILFSSCTKKSSEINDETTYKISVDVSGFSQTIDTISRQNSKSSTISNNESLNGKITKLVYSIFDRNGKLVRNTQQNAEVSNFGFLSERLPAGNYSLCIAGGQPKMTIYENPLIEGTDISYYSFPWEDTFYKKINFTVQNSDVQITALLERIVGMVEVNVVDELPSNVAKMSVSVNRSPFFYNFLNGPRFNTSASSNIYTVTKDITAEDRTNHSCVVQVYCLNFTESMFVTIKALDSKGVAVAEKAISQVYCTRNRKTTLTGRLSGGSGAFTVTANTVWEAPIDFPF